MYGICGAAATSHATSPTAAVHDFLIAVSTLDVRRVVQLMPPDELPALHEYAGMFVPDAENAVRETRKQYTVSLPGLELVTDGSGSTRTVKIAKVGVRVDFATADGEEVNAAVDGRCITITVSGDAKKRCGADVVKLVEDFGGPKVDTKAFDEARKTQAATSKKAPNLGFVVVQRGGTWYVSPSRTMLGGMTETLKILTRADLDKLVEAGKQAAEQITTGVSGSSSQQASPAPTQDSTGSGEQTDSSFTLGS